MNLDLRIILLLQVHGKWAAWGDWTACSATCNAGGTRKRTRTCTDPAPIHGGDDCDSTSVGSLETESCNTNIVCPGMILLLVQTIYRFILY